MSETRPVPQRPEIRPGGYILPGHRDLPTKRIPVIVWMISAFAIGACLLSGAFLAVMQALGVVQP